MSSGNLKRKVSFNKLDYKPKRLGLVYSPPEIGKIILIILVIEYLIPSLNKLYHHKIKLEGIIETSTTEEIVKHIYNCHSDYLETKKLSKEMLEKLVEKISVKLKKKSKISKIIFLDEPDYETDPQKYINYYKDFDLNKLSEEELTEHKNKMEKIYLKNAILPDHKDFIYDKQMDFNTDKYDAEWDDEDEDEEANTENNYF